MDGKFVKNKTWTYGQVKNIIKDSKIPLDVHLMVKNPKSYIEDYALLNTSIITFHYEAVNDIEDMIEFIKGYGLRVGLAINPETKVDEIYDYLKNIDQVLIMSVHPGASGQSFIEKTPNRIRMIKDEIIKQGLNTQLEVDGGINDETSKLCVEAGVDILVSATFLHQNLKDNIRYLKEL